MSRRYDEYGGDYRMYGAPFAGWYPGAFWGGAPMYGWGAWGGAFDWPPYPAASGYGAYDREYRRARRPDESPAYGSAGDRAARRWAERYGYDVEYTVRPHEGYRGRYDRNFRRGRR